MSPTDLSVSLVHHALLLQPAGVCSSRSFWVSCPYDRRLETREMVQPSTGPAGPGGDAAASYQRANPTTLSTDRPPPLGHQLGQLSPQAHLPLAVRLAGRSPRRPLARKREKLNWWPPPRSGPVVVDPRASVWKIRLHPAGLSGGSSLTNLIPPTTVACSMKTRLRTPMTPTNPLTGLSQVLLRLPWPPAPLVTLPSHPSDGRGVFHSASPCLCTWQTFHRFISRIISLI